MSALCHGPEEPVLCLDPNRSRWSALEATFRLMAQAWERHPDPRWQAIFPSVATLQDEMGLWPVGLAVPSGVAALLSLSRDLIVDFLLRVFIHAYRHGESASSTRG